MIGEAHLWFDALSRCVGAELSTSISRMRLAVWSPGAWSLTQSICNTGGIFLPADFLVVSLGKWPSHEVGQAWWRRLTEMKTSGGGGLWSDSAPAVHSSMFCGKALRVPAERRDWAVIRHHRLCLKYRALCPLLETSSRCPTTIGFSFQRIHYARENKDSRSLFLSRSLLFFFFSSSFWKWLERMSIIMRIFFSVSERLNDSRNKYRILDFLKKKSFRCAFKVNERDLHTHTH